MTIKAEGQMQTPESNKQVMYRLWNAVGSHDFDTVAACYHPDAVYYIGSNKLEGQDAIVDYYRGYLAAFPDFQGEVERIAAEGDLVAHQACVQGTNSGEFLGIPATNKFASVSGMLFTRMKDGKIIEEWESFDYSEVMRQLGLA